MRVILTQSVPKLGEAGEVCNVANGYGRNYLLPQRLAILATTGALRQVDDLKRTESRRLDGMRSTVQLLADRITATSLSFTAKVGETGRLYGAITSSDIAEQLESRINESVDRRKILLDEPIKTLGDHDVTIHLMPGVDAVVKVKVVPDREVMMDRGLRDEFDEDDEGFSSEDTTADEPAAAAVEPEAADHDADLESEIPSESPDAEAGDGTEAP